MEPRLKAVIFFAAIAGLVKFANLIEQRELLSFAAKCHGFDYFYPLA